MTFPLLPYITFSLVTIFTPGPNNISSMGFGLQQGYRKTVKYLIGICIGVFVLFMATSLFTTLLGRFIPRVFSVLKYIGAAYIVFLGVQLIISSFKEKENGKIGKAGLLQGMLLQLLNPKGMIYYLTVFTVFIHPHFGSLFVDLIFAAILIILVFASVSLYTVGGNVVKLIIKRRKVYLAVNILLAAALFYSALAIILSDVKI